MENQLEKLWYYNKWANKLIIQDMMVNLEEVPASCLRLLSHIINTQLIWSSRINGDESAVDVWDLHTLIDCLKYHNESSEKLKDYVLDFNRYDRIIIYKNSKNLSFENLLEDILLHIFNHGTYHRAQIATEMRRNGLAPLNTDFITYKRLSL